MKKMRTYVFILFILFNSVAVSKPKRISTVRVWKEISEPINLYNNYGLDSSVKYWDDSTNFLLKERPNKEVLSIDLNGDGQLDKLYTSWFHNGRAGKTMEWYTISKNNKHYGWVEESAYDDGSKIIRLRGSKLFDLHHPWKTIRVPIAGKTIYGLLSEGGYSHGYFGSKLVYFEKNAKGEYEVKRKLLMLTRTHGEPNNPPDVRVYDDGYKTILNEESAQGEKLYYEKIGQYILTPKGESSYKVVSSFNYYEAVKAAVKEKRQKDTASKKLAKKTKTIKQPVPAPVKQTITTTEPQPRQPVTKTKEPTQSNNNLFWLLLMGIGGLVGVMVITRWVRSRKS